MTLRAAENFNTKYQLKRDIMLLYILLCQKYKPACDIHIYNIWHYHNTCRPGAHCPYFLKSNFSKQYHFVVENPLLQLSVPIVLD